MQKDRYSIGEASVACSIPIKTLRYYDEIELLQPEYRDADSNYRYYSKPQLTNLLIIRILRAQGFSLKDIKDLVSDPNLAVLEDKMKKRREEIDNEIRLLRTRRDSCEALLDRLHRGMEIVHDAPPEVDGVRPFDPRRVKIEMIPRGTMIYSREIMKQYRNADVSLQRWTDIYEQCAELGIHVRSSVIVTYYDNPLDQFLMKDCDVEFGILVDEDELPTKDIPNLRQFGDFPAATYYHVGKYRNIIQSHVALIQWLHQKNYEMAGNISESFLISPLDIVDENLYVTKIMIPIKKA